MTLTILPRLVEGTLEDMEDGFHIRQTKLFKYVVGVRVSVPTSQDKPDPDQTSQDKPDPYPDTSVLKIFQLFYDEF